MKRRGIVKKSERQEKLVDLGKINNLPAKPHKMGTEYTKEDMQKLIDECKGMTSIMVVQSGFNFRQVWNCIKEYGLQDYLEDSKKALVSEAERVLLESLYSNSDITKIKAVEMILRSRIGQEAGYGTAPNVQIQQNIVSDNDKMTQIKNIFGIKNDKEE